MVVVVTIYVTGNVRWCGSPFHKLQCTWFVISQCTKLSTHFGELRVINVLNNSWHWNRQPKPRHVHIMQPWQGWS